MTVVSERAHNHGQLVARITKDTKDGNETFSYHFVGNSVNMTIPQIMAHGITSKEKAQVAADGHAAKLFEQAEIPHSCSAESCAEWVDR